MKRLIATLAIFGISLSLSSCAIFTSSCDSLKKDVNSKEFFGELLYGEYEIQRNRYLAKTVSEMRLSEATVDLLKNYSEVQELLAKKPECLVKPELAKTLTDSKPVVANAIQTAGISDSDAYRIMLGPKDESHLSFIKWIK